MYSGAPLQVGDSVPNFSCDSTLGVTTFHEVLDGQFSLLVTFPRNFEAVGTTEMGQIAKLKEEFEARNVKVFALSVDTKMNHRRWISDIEELQVSWSEPDRSFGNLRTFIGLPFRRACVRF